MHHLNLLETFRNFFRSRSGSAVPTVAIMLVPLLGAAGAALDYANIASVRSGMQNAADAAVLGVVRETAGASDEEVQRKVVEYFNANSDVDIKLVRETRIEGEVIQNRLTVNAEADVKLLLMKHLGKEFARVSVSASVLTSQNPVEMALVIDNTKSMDFGGSWNTVAAALGDVLETIEGETGANAFHVTVVPYTDRVNITTNRQSWLKYQDSLDDWRGCTEPTESPVYGLPYAIDLNAKPGDFVPTVPKYWSGRAAEGENKSECASPIVGPTTDIDDVRDELDDLEPKKATGRFDDALVWGWRAITARWQGLWNGDKSFPSDREDREKIIALFTDGRTNINKFELERKKGEFGNNNGSITLFNHFAYVCEEIKDDGVSVFIFDTGKNKHAEKFFKGCAEENYFKVRTQKELLAAIRELGGSAIAPRLIN